jgi:L-fucose isomerase-like protein
MKKAVVKLGYCPTRRDLFSREEAVKYAKLIKDTISSLDSVKIVDLYDINEEGLLYDDAHLKQVIKHFRDSEIDALFFPHCNFGSESLVAEVAKALGVPVLLWGPRDDAPLENGMRLRDSQCGLFATGKVLRRHNIPFTYITNSWYDSKEFRIGFEKFLAVANVVKAIKGLRILQISTRPEPFSSVICNENELLERFGIRLMPITLTEIVSEMDAIAKQKPVKLTETVEYIQRNISKDVEEDNIIKMVSLKMAIRQKALQYGCRAAAIQCWNALQDMICIMPCLANALLADEGFPVACETDIHGAITAVMVQAAAMNEKPHFFADVTVRHPEDDNAELLWHCGAFPYSLAKDKSKAKAGAHWILQSGAYGTCEWEIYEGKITIARFDGDHGRYQLFIGEAESTDGPKTRGSYRWIKVKDWAKWEHKLVKGPYIHHVAGIHGEYGEILAEACQYLNELVPDPVEPSIEELERRWF